MFASGIGAYQRSVFILVLRHITSQPPFTYFTNVSNFYSYFLLVYSLYYENGILKCYIRKVKEGCDVIRLR